MLWKVHEVVLLTTWRGKKGEWVTFLSCTHCLQFRTVLFYFELSYLECNPVSSFFLSSCLASLTIFFSPFSFLFSLSLSVSLFSLSQLIKMVIALGFHSTHEIYETNWTLLAFLISCNGWNPKYQPYKNTGSIKGIKTSNFVQQFHPKIEMVSIMVEWNDMSEKKIRKPLGAFFLLNYLLFHSLEQLWLWSLSFTFGH